MERERRYDVFLSYNRQDQAAVRTLAEDLRQQGLQVRLDQDFHGGSDWQKEIEIGIRRSRSVIVAYGPSGLGKWQEKEVKASIAEEVDRRLPVIPVFLPGAPENPSLPIFLSGYTWIDLRTGLAGPEFAKLLQSLPRSRRSKIRKVDASSTRAQNGPVHNNAFNQKEILAKIEELLDRASTHICLVGLPGSGISTTLRELAGRRRVRLVDGRALQPRDLEGASGVIAVLGYPGLGGLTRLATVAPERVRIVAGGAVSPESMEPVLMPLLSDQDILSMLGEAWAEWIQEVVCVTGRSPGAVRRLHSLLLAPSASGLEEVQVKIWGESEIKRAEIALSDLAPDERALLATLAIRGTVHKELWNLLINAAGTRSYSELDSRNPLSPFLLAMNNSILLRPEITRAVEKSEYKEALPRLGKKVIEGLACAREMHTLISSIGRIDFRKVLDDARTIAFTKVAFEPATEATDGLGYITRRGSLDSEEEGFVTTTWRVLVHIVQLLPPWGNHIDDTEIWVQLLSAVVRSSDIDVRLRGAESMLQRLRDQIRDELRTTSHWSLVWSRETIPGPLLSEMLHHDPGSIIPEVNAVVFGREDHCLWSAGSDGLVYKWNWRTGKGSRYGPEKVQQSEVWSIAVVDDRIVISAADEGSVALRSSGRFDKKDCRRGAMMNAVAEAEGIVVAGSDDSVVHLWRLVDDDNFPRLIGHEIIGNANAGWTLSCLIVSRNEVYSGHEEGILCRWMRQGDGSWIRKRIILDEELWVRTLRGDPISGEIFAACADGKVLRYNPASDLRPRIFAEHGASVRGMAFVRNSDIHLATGGDDGVIRLWSAEGREVSSFGAHVGIIRALDSRGSMLASCGTDGFARVWDLGPSVRPPRLEAMDTDGMVVHLRAGDTLRAFLASTGRETGLVKTLRKAKELKVNGREILTSRGRIELPTTCLVALCSSDEEQVLTTDIGGRIYFFRWNKG